MGRPKKSKVTTHYTTALPDDESILHEPDPQEFCTVIEVPELQAIKLPLYPDSDIKALDLLVRAAYERIQSLEERVAYLEMHNVKEKPRQTPICVISSPV